MHPLTVDEIRPPSAYEPVRAESRRAVIALKRHRRVPLGDRLTLVFENRDTVRGVVEELLRAERIEEPERIAQELDVFNALIPGEGELSATLFIEVVDAADLASSLGTLRGIEEHVHLEVGGERLAQAHEEGRSREDRTSSVHYLRFRLTEAQRASLLREAPVTLVADHPAYAARSELGEEQRAALAADLLGR